MGEVNATSDGAFHGGDNSNSNSDRVHDWETGLPNLSDITPLSHGLIPRGLLSAFNIKPEPYRTAVDVANASEKTMITIRGSAKAGEVVDGGDGDVGGGDGDAEGDGDVDEMSEAKKPRRNVSPEDADSAAAAKPTRLVWTPQLHKRFVDVVAHLGIKNSVPKTIMQLMNVEGLTRENVASHLQKYRLYLKRNSFDSSPVESSGTVQMNPAQVPVQMKYNQQHHQQQPQPQPQMNNYNNQYNQAYNRNNYGVMQTGNSSYNNTNMNNQYKDYASYHHLNRNNYPHQVTPDDN